MKTIQVKKEGIEIFRVNPRLPLSNLIEKAFYSLPCGEYSVNIYRRFATIIQNAEIVKEVKLNFLSESEFQLAISCDGVLNFGKHHHKTENRMKRLLQEGFITNLSLEEDNIIATLW